MSHFDLILIGSRSDTTFVTDLDTPQPGSLVRLSEASDDYGQVWSFTQGFTRGELCP